MGILTDEMKQMLLGQRLIFVATIDADGTPNLSPKATTMVFDDDHIVFGDIRSPGTVRNLARNPAMEINVVDPVIRKGFRFKGEARVVREGKMLDELREELVRRGTTNVTKAAIELRVTRVLRVTSPAYDRGAKEEEIRERFLDYFDRLYGR
jgi:hypothetical protein